MASCRIDATDDAMRAYWAGRIDGLCLQNAFTLEELETIARGEGFRVDWRSALAEVG